MINWNDYLASLRNHYAQWWNAYTLTDVVGQQRIEQRQSSLLLNFTVETLRTAKDERSETQEKTERLDVLAGLRKYAKEHVLLVGRPGSGKSTALARLLLEEAEKPLPQPLPEAERGVHSPPSLVGKGAGGLGQIPILVELRYYQTSVLDLIRDFLMRHRLLLNTETIKQLLCDGQFLLLIDGINELPSEAARRDLSKFRQDYQNTTPMIFTTRDLGVGGDLGITKKLEMQPLTAEQMQQFVRAYLPEQGEQMLQNLGDRLREFGETPLLLLMLCSLFQATGDIPPNLGLVFRQFTQHYERQYRQDIPVTDESRRWWFSLLKHLAFHMTKGDKLTELNVAIPKSKAEDVLTQFLKDEGFDRPRDRALQWLQDLLNNHLIQPGANDQIEFRHQLIQEYYTAEYLLKQLPNLSDDCLQRECLNYLKWTEPLKLMLELVDDEAQAVRVVNLALEVDYQLGAKLAGAVKPQLQQQTVNLVAELEIPLLFKIRLLGLTKSETAVAPLIKLLEDEDSDVRRRAASALGEIKSETAVAPLIKLLEDEDSDVRRRAASALGEIKSEAAIPGLIQLLEDEDFYVRDSAAYALGEIKSEAALLGLIQLLEDEDSDVRDSAAYALGEIKSEAAIPGLIQLLEHEDFYVRHSAAEALKNIESSQEVLGLIQLSEDAKYRLRFMVTDALGKIKSKEAVPRLIQLLKDEDDDVCSSAACALGKIKSIEAVPGLIQLLEHKNSDVRSVAVCALGKIKSEEAVPGLIQLLEDEDSDVRFIAACALGKIKSGEAIPGLIQLLEDEDSDVRFIAACALGKIKSEQPILGLIQLLEDENSDVRSSAACALGKIKSEEAVPGLIQLLEDENSDVRSSVADILEEINSEQVVPKLIQLLEDEDDNVRSSAADALREIKSEQVVPKFIQLLEYEDDEDDDVHFFTADTLRKIKSEQMVPKLIQLLEDEDNYVRFIAVDALEEIKSEQVVPKLIQLLKDEDDNVRSSAAYALGETKSEQGITLLINQLTDEEFVSANNGDTLHYALLALEAIQENCQYYNCLTEPKPQLYLPPSQPIKTSLMYILHLSDLHFGTPDQAKRWSNQLASDLKQELDIPHLDALILSGDIANKSTPAEYAAAQQFLNELRQEFTLEPEQIIIVPGNHDLNWSLAKDAYTAYRRERYQGKLEQEIYIDDGGNYIEVADKEKYKQRFEHFRNFYQIIKTKPYPLDYDQQYTLDHFPTQNLLILGLNSAWQLDHHYKSRANININALTNALKEIRRNQNYKNCLKIAVWHHPLDSAWEDRIKDQSFMEQLAVAGFRLFLHGHVHQTQKSFNEYDAERGLFRICAGTFGAPTHELVTAEPWQYHLLKLENNTLTVRSRKRKTENGAWEADNCWRQGKGKPSADFYTITWE